MEKKKRDDASNRFLMLTLGVIVLAFLTILLFRQLQPFKPLTSPGNYNCNDANVICIGSEVPYQPTFNLDQPNKTYVLTQDVSSPTLIGFNLKAGDIIFDCDGYTINGNDYSNGFEFEFPYAVAYSNIVIKNCNIKSFRTAIFIGANSQNFSNIQIIDNTIENSVSNGISIGAGGEVSQYSAYNILIKGNNITGPREGSGITLRNVKNSIVEENVIEKYNQFGIEVFGLSSNNLISNNKIYDTIFTIRGDIGIALYGTDEIKLLNNEIYGNNASIHVEDTTNAIIRANKIYPVKLLDGRIRRPAFGIFLNNGDGDVIGVRDSVIEDNQILEGIWGVVFKGGRYNPTVNNTVFSNNLVCSHVTDSEAGSYDIFSGKSDLYCRGSVLGSTGTSNRLDDFKDESNNGDCASIEYSACPVSICGDLYIEGNEECDDGNNDNNDGCDSNCNLEGPGGGAECGNGNLETGEECDDGNLIDGDGCDSNCRIETPGDQSVCGNGAIETSEQCDCGNPWSCSFAELGNKICNDVGNYVGGSLSCYDTNNNANKCRYDVSGCIPGDDDDDDGDGDSVRCGDGIVSHRRGEYCDINNNVLTYCYNSPEYLRDPELQDLDPSCQNVNSNCKCIWSLNVDENLVAYYTYGSCYCPESDDCGDGMGISDKQKKVVNKFTNETISDDIVGNMPCVLSPDSQQKKWLFTDSLWLPIILIVLVIAFFLLIYRLVKYKRLF